MVMAVTANHKTNPVMDPYMSVPLGASLLFHGLIIVLAVAGLPYVKPDLPPAIDNSISVEIVEIDEITQTDKAPRKTEPSKNEPEKADPQPKEQPPKAAAPKVTAQEPPKLTDPRPPELEIEKQESAEPKKTPMPVKKPVMNKAESKPEPEPDYKPVLLDDAEAQPQEDFDSVLKNLIPDEVEQTAGSQESAQGEKPSLLAKMSQRVTRSEMDTLRQQLSQCWNLQAGARYAEDLVVPIKLFMNPDRTVRKAVVVDQIRYNTDSYYRAAADSARRAVNNPHCIPLELPPEKYETWKEMTVTFDPRDMLQ